MPDRSALYKLTVTSRSSTQSFQYLTPFFRSLSCFASVPLRNLSPPANFSMNAICFLSARNFSICTCGRHTNCGMNCSSARVPSLHHSREGWPSDQENIAERPLTARPGWFSDRTRKENHSVCAGKGGFATFDLGRSHPSLL